MKVRLEPKRVQDYARRKLFQFHEGTIGTECVNFDLRNQFIFQFHEGTIGTGVTAGIRWNF